MMTSHLSMKSQGELWLRYHLSGDWVFFQCEHDDISAEYRYSYMYVGNDAELVNRLSEFQLKYAEDDEVLGVKSMYYVQPITGHGICLSMVSQRAWITLLSEKAWTKATKGLRRI